MRFFNHNVSTIIGGLQQNIAEMLELQFIYEVLAMPFPPADSFSGEKISHQNDVN